MPRAICWALIGAMLGIAVFSLATEYAGCQPGLLHRLGHVVTAPMPKPAAEIASEQEESAAYATDVPHLLDALLPDPAKLTADWPLWEPINLLKSPEMASQPKPDNVRIPAEIVPVAAIRSADEAVCFRRMPYCETPELLPIMPHAEETAGAEEEQSVDPVADPARVEERLNRILQSYLRNGRYPGQAEVDTLEFRPSDARKGEFDRIAF